MSHQIHSFCDRISRRNMIQAGLAGTIGLSLPNLLRLQAQSAEQNNVQQRDTAVIYLELAGGPTHHETYDPKPLSPQEYRGPFGVVPTNVPGVQFSELMVEQARVMDKMAIVRSIQHNSGSHGTSSHLTQTGYYLRDRQNRENEMPSIGSVAAKLRGANAPGMPGFVSIPRSMRYGRAAWLGKGHNPFETVRNADTKNFEVPNLSLTKGLTSERLHDRQTLLASFDATRRMIDNRGVADAIDDFTLQAFDMVSGDAARTAFDLDEEDAKTRKRYGMNSTGQNLLLARRLVERGVTYCTVRVTGWDDHVGIAKRMKSKGPAYDQGVAALIEDLYQRGLDRKVLVLCMGEFGRTPRVNKRAGRDHWGRAMSVAFAGGGLKTGQVVGATDGNGSSVQERPYRPENVLAVVYRHLGIDPAMTIEDPSGRPRHLLEERELIHELI